MKNKKLTGSFYTPKIIADFLIDYLSDKTEGNGISILEPSAGDGVFIKSIFENQLFLAKVKKIVAVERNKSEAKKIKSITNNKSLQTHHIDFLNFQKKCKKEFDLVIGNPPYIKKSLLTDEQISLCSEVHSIFPSLSGDKIKNIWTAFLIRSISYVNSNGLLAFVLPSELLQVKFASELRELLLDEFEHIEIFTFNELLFKECKGQDTLLLICKRKSNDKGVYFCNIEKLIDLKDKRFSLIRSLKTKEVKWTHYYLTSEEIELLEKLSLQLKPIHHYCSSKVGIVTAANDYFIIDQQTVQEYSLQHFVKPIIQRGSFINGSVILTKSDFANLVNDSKPAFLIALNDSFKISSNGKLHQYLLRGIELKINERYKTNIREKWYEVPNVGSPPDAFFFRRCNEYPKLVKNEANVLSTDSGYSVTINDSYNIESLIFSFYNSLTLSFAELNGRHYGGGVLELTPNEFKNLPMPYINIKNISFYSFINDFRNKESIKDICKENDTIILKSIDNNLDSENIEKIFKIREKLYRRRTRLTNIANRSHM